MSTQNLSDLSDSGYWGFLAFKLCIAGTTGKMEWPESRNDRKPEKTGKARMTRMVPVLIHWCNDVPCAFIGNADRICCANYLLVNFGIFFLVRRTVPIGAKCYSALIILHIMSESDLSNVLTLVILLNLSPNGTRFARCHFRSRTILDFRALPFQRPS